MANAYTQEIILDADGKPIVDALTQVRGFMADIQKIVSGIGITAEKDAKAWATALSSNIKQLKQAESDLRTLQADRVNRTKGFQDAETAAKRIADAEVRADKQANQQKLVEAKVYYGERNRLAREEVAYEKQIAREITEFERSQDRAAIASAREVAAARREAATAAVTSKARGITNRDDASAAKAASDARLNNLRREREATAATDAEGARGIANRIAVEKALGRELDATITRLNRQTEAERKLQEAATRRLQGIGYKDQTLLAGSAVQKTAASLGNAGALGFYKNEQATAASILRARIADARYSAEERVAAQKNLEIANRRVAEAQKLVNEEAKVAAALERQERAAARVVAQEQRAAEQTIRRTQQEERAAAAAARRTPMGRIATAATNLGLSATSSR